MYSEIRRFAGAFIFDPCGQVILQLRDQKAGIDNPGTISVFGGSLEEGESYLAGLRRELKEELNIDINEGDVELLAPTEKVENNIKTECQFYLLRGVDPSSCCVTEGRAVIMAVHDALGDDRLTPTCRNMLMTMTTAEQ